MLEQLLLSGLKRYAPEIKEHGAPVIKQLLCQLLDEYKPKLQGGEESVDIGRQVQDRIPYFMVCSMSSDNKVIRCLKALTTEELLDMAEDLAKKYKIL